jgi:fucose 4-O-acetylase-like acetyltransferase
MKQRLLFIDALKGIAILLVVLGHSFGGVDLLSHDKNNVYITLYNFIYGFHMPLFFFISGYLFNFKKYLNHFNGLATSRFMSLILPYICFSLLLVLMVSILNRFSWSYFNNIINLRQFWFLPCLFLVELMYYVLSKYFYNKNKIVLAGLILLLGLSSSLITYQFYTWSILKVALVALAFYYIGHLMRDEIRFDLKSALFVCGGGAVIFLIYGGINSTSLNTATISTYDYFTYCAVAMAGIMALYLGTKIAYERGAGSRVLEFLGVNSILLYVLQIFIMELLMKYIPSIFDGYHVYLVAVLMVLCAIPCILIINRYLPFLIGKGYNKLTIN